VIKRTDLIEPDLLGYTTCPNGVKMKVGTGGHQHGKEQETEPNINGSEWYFAFQGHEGVQKNGGRVPLRVGPGKTTAVSPTDVGRQRFGET